LWLCLVAYYVVVQVSSQKSLAQLASQLEQVYNALIQHNQKWGQTMSDYSMTKTVEDYFIAGCGRCPLGGTPECKIHTWYDALVELRRIVNDSELEETSKWGVPCYTYGGKNVAMISALKGYAALSFFKGALMDDPHGMLEKQGKNTQADRIVRITDVQQVHDNEAILRDLIGEAIRVETAGLQYEYKRVEDYDIPEELQQKFDDDPSFQAAFEALTPGRQKGYLLHFGGAKQAQTRINRIEKFTARIFEGLGMHDRD
jgi:uncharacterized protein YdeI (YjbR/CyaY-like superfamily)